MMRFLRCQKGSSSILVAMVLVILLVFAGLSIANATANMKLARKNAETTTLYYSLDSEGERVMHQIRKSVRESREWADQAIEAIKAGKTDGLDLPEALATEIQRAKSHESVMDPDQIDIWYAELANLQARRTLETLYPGCTENVQEPLDLSGEEKTKPKLGFMFKRTIILDHQGTYRYLNLSIRMDAPKRGENPEERCKVMEWRLWQEPFEYTNQVDLWEGKP